MRRFLPRGTPAIFCLMLLLTAGCAGAGRSGGDSRPALTDSNRELVRGSLAAVEIHGHPVSTVMETVESVFTEAGFRVASTKSDQITFERIADRSTKAAYGNWQGEDVRIRLRVDLLEQSTGRVLAICRSHVAREAGTMAEDEQTLGRRRVRRYAPLLHEVASRLN